MVFGKWLLEEDLREESIAAAGEVDPVVAFELIGQIYRLGDRAYGHGRAPSLKQGGGFHPLKASCT